MTDDYSKPGIYGLYGACQFCKHRNPDTWYCEKTKEVTLDDEECKNFEDSDK